jgi:hypothetical protein
LKVGALAETITVTGETPSSTSKRQTQVVLTGDALRAFRAPTRKATC